MEINSLQNARVKEWAKLKQKKYRDEAGCFLVEGEHLIEEADKAGLVKCIITLNEKKDLFPAYEHFIVTRAILDKLSTTVSGTSIMALCRLPDRFDISGDRFILLDRIQDPGNLGTILRSAYSFGYENISGLCRYLQRKSYPFHSGCTFSSENKNAAFGYMHPGTQAEEDSCLCHCSAQR